MPFNISATELRNVVVLEGAGKTRLGGISRTAIRAEPIMLKK